MDNLEIDLVDEEEMEEEFSPFSGIEDIEEESLDDEGLTEIDVEGIEDLGDPLDFDMDEIFETAMFLEEQNRFLEDPFDGKYYTGYLGFNPLTIYKENSDVIQAVAYLNFDQNRMSFLIKDLERFNDGVKYIELQEKDLYRDAKTEEEKEMHKEEITKINQVYMKMEEKINVLKDIYNIKAYSITNEIGGKREITTEALAKQKKIQDDILNDVLGRPKTQDKEIIRLSLIESVDKLTSVLEAIESYIAFSKDTQSKYGDKVKAYVDKTYRYTTEEERLLDKLRFPMVYKHREHLDKIVPNVEDGDKDKIIDVDLRADESKRIYKMFNVYNVLNKLAKSQGRPSDLFKVD